MVNCGISNVVPLVTLQAAQILIQTEEVRSDTWSVANDVSANATVTYNYPALSGPYSVYFNGTNYEFCTAPNAAPVATVTIVATGGDPNVRVCP